MVKEKFNNILNNNNINYFYINLNLLNKYK